MLNLSSVVHSSVLGQQAVNVKRSSGEWVGGRFVKDEPSTHLFYGIITLASPKDLQQVPEGDRVTGSIKILTTDRLLQTRTDGTGDIVTWRGAEYKILTVSPDIDYGFYRSIACRLDGEGIG